MNHFPVKHSHDGIPVEIGQAGIAWNQPCPNVSRKNHQPDSATRSKLTEFSKKSRYRLRQTIFEIDYYRYVTDLQSAGANALHIYGVTFTTPNWCGDFKYHWRSFVSNMNRAHGRFYFLERREQQRNGNMHTHCLFIVTQETMENIQIRWIQQVLRYVKKNEVDIPEKCGWPGSFFRRGVDWEPLDNPHAAFKYLLDHTSKAKKGQLLTCGRHWVEHNVDLKPIQANNEFLTIPFACATKVSRWMSKRQRIRVGWGDSVWDRRLSTPSRRLQGRGRHILFCSADIARADLLRMVEYLEKGLIS